MALTGRAVCNIGFLERPLVIGFVWWAVTGEAVPALPLALFFELFWLDLYPIGGFIPPMPAFPYLLLLVLCARFSWESPSAIAFPLALLLPFAYVIPLVEAWQRNRLKGDSLAMLEAIERGGALPAAMPWRIIAGTSTAYLVLGFLAFAVVSMGLSFLASAALEHEGMGALPLRLNWPVLFAVAALGAVVGLRLRRVYLTLMLAALAVALGKLFF